jgi:hypothetical protein
MAFSRHTISRIIMGNTGSNFFHDTTEFMSSDQREFKGALGPFIPFIYMKISPANSRMGYFDFDIIGTTRGDRNIFQPNPFFG